MHECDHQPIGSQSLLMDGSREKGIRGDLSTCANCGEAIKRCGNCKRYKATKRFATKKKESRSGLHSWCKDCLKAKRPIYDKAWITKDPTRRKRIKLKTRYGITLEQFADILTLQEGRCAICRSADPRQKTGWGVDHNHSTGEVRGLLCYPCNMTLGYHETYDTPVAAVFLDYIKNPPARQVLRPALIVMKGGKPDGM